MLRVADMLLASPLISEPLMDSEPDMDLNRESCGVLVEERLRDPLRALPIPLA